MDFLQILVLAVLQGVTEFLPISSSGHLLLVPILTGWQDQGVGLDIATHVGTLLAVFMYFRADFIDMSKALLGLGAVDAVTDGRRLFRHLVIGSLPALLAGAGLYFLSDLNLRSLLMVATTTLVFGVVLGIADRFFKGARTLRNMTNWDALFIGLFQVIALFPGSSRSGMTMAAALFRGFERAEATRFSMLLSVPIIAAAGLAMTAKEIVSGDAAFGQDALLVGAVSFAVAYVVIKTLMAWINKMGFMPFVIYRLALAIFLLGLYFSG